MAEQIFTVTVPSCERDRMFGAIAADQTLFTNEENVTNL